MILLKVTGYCEGAWFKNNFAKMLSACNYYAGVATTSNAVSFRSLWNKSVLQESAPVRSYLTWEQIYSRYTVQIFVTSFLKLCGSVRPVFLVYPGTHHTYFWGTDKSFLKLIILVVEKHLGLTSKISVLRAWNQVSWKPYLILQKALVSPSRRW